VLIYVKAYLGRRVGSGPTLYRMRGDGGETPQHQVVEQWRAAAVALAARRADELRGMSDEDARVAGLQLLAMAGRMPRKTGSSGLVEQQRLFRRARA